MAINGSQVDPGTNLESSLRCSGSMAENDQASLAGPDSSTGEIRRLFPEHGETANRGHFYCGMTLRCMGT